MNLDKYYQTLGIGRNASQTEIKKRFRELALEYHPDRSPTTESKFKEILEAYEILSGKRKVPKEGGFRYATEDVGSKITPEYWDEIFKDLNNRYNTNPRRWYSTGEEDSLDIEKRIRNMAIISVGLTVAGALLQYFGGLDLILEDCPSGKMNNGILLGAVFGVIGFGCYWGFEEIKDYIKRDKF